MRALLGLMGLASVATATALEPAMDAYLAASDPVSPFHVQVRLVAWLASVNGDVTEQGGTVDLAQLGVDDVEINVFPEVNVELGKWRIGLTAIFLKHEANSAAAADFTYGGANYTTGDAIFTKFRFDNYDARVLREVTSRQNGWRVWVGGGASYFNVDVKVLGESAEGVALPTATVPFFALAVRRAWDRLYVEAELAVMPFESGDLDGLFVGAQIIVGYQLGYRSHIEVGYKILVMDGAADGTDFDSLVVEGFLIAVAFYF